MPDPNLRSEFLQDGFCVQRQFLNTLEIEQLSAELERYIRDVVPGLPATYSFYDDPSRPDTLKQMQKMNVDSFFDAYSRHPKWVGLAETLLDEPAKLESMEWFNKPAGTVHPTPPHQDNYYINAEPANILTIWVALDEVDEENGCLRFVPGSHTAGRREHSVTQVLGFSQGIQHYGPKEQSREVVVPLSPGDATVHHGWTIHRADPNMSATRQRRSMAMVFLGESAGFDEERLRAHREQLSRQHEKLLPQE